MIKRAQGPSSIGGNDHLMQRELLLTFLDVFETRNFHRSADRLGLSQSTVSGRIRQLEADLGARLFERGRGGADPTPAGRRFEPQCRSLLALWGQAVGDAIASTRYDSLLRISVQFSLLRSLLPAWTRELRRALPKVALHLELDYSLQIMRDIGSGAIDLGVVYAPQHLPDLVVESIGAVDYAMVSTEAARLSEVRPERYIRPGYTAGFERQHDSLLPHLAHPPLAAGCEDLAVELLRLYGGATYVPLGEAARLAAGGLGLRVVEDAPAIQQPVFTVVHFRRRNAPKLQQALRLLRREGPAAAA